MKAVRYKLTYDGVSSPQLSNMYASIDAVKGFFAYDITKLKAVDSELFSRFVNGILKDCNFGVHIEEEQSKKKTTQWLTYDYVVVKHIAMRLAGCFKPDTITHPIVIFFADGTTDNSAKQEHQYVIVTPNPSKSFVKMVKTFIITTLDENRPKPSQYFTEFFYIDIEADEIRPYDNKKIITGCKIVLCRLSEPIHIRKFKYLQQQFGNGQLKEETTAAEKPLSPVISNTTTPNVVSGVPIVWGVNVPKYINDDADDDEPRTLKIFSPILSETHVETLRAAFLANRQMME